MKPASVAIIGGGVAGLNALRMAFGLGADVTVIDRDLDRLRYLDEIFAGRISTEYSTKDTIEETVLNSDLVVGTVLVPGAAAPKLITRAMVDEMRPGSVIVDVAVDQGRMCGDYQSNNACRADLYRGRSYSLLCGEYAWRGATHFDDCTE